MDTQSTILMSQKKVPWLPADTPSGHLDIEPLHLEPGDDPVVSVTVRWETSDRCDVIVRVALQSVHDDAKYAIRVIVTPLDKDSLPVKQDWTGPDIGDYDDHIYAGTMHSVHGVQTSAGRAVFSMKLDQISDAAFLLVEAKTFP